MRNTFSVLVLAGGLLVLLCCKGGDPQKITPVNLTVETNISTDSSGQVSFHATADKAVNFKFYFGEGLNNPSYSKDGTIEHTYLSSGTYTATILAYSADSLFIEKTMSLTMLVKEPPIPTTGYMTPDNYAGMTLVWRDEFNGDQLNTSDWNYETGGGGWGNNELEYYQQPNTSVQGGNLIIEARKENVGGSSFTSSRLTTQGKQAFQFGRVDIRAVLPKGQGLWPALWMLGTSITSVGWPQCGEVDIMEMIGGGGKDSTVYGTAHWYDGGHQSLGGHTSLRTGKIFADEFHVFSILWNASSVTWYVDDAQYFTLPITSDPQSELRQQFFFIFNVAVGGDWPGSPDATTVFPQRMVVDYIRVFQ